jgi:general secretion pathway protein D
VTFDAATNSLVVYSSLKDYQSLRRVIDKLDLPRKQIYVEALVMEVLLDKTRTMGVSYHGGYPIKGTSFPGTEGDSVAIGGFNAGKTLSPAALATDLTGLAGALFGPALSATATRIFGTNVDIPSFGAFVKILQENNDVNVLSSPHLLITNNQEGEISVGQNLPFPGSFIGGGLGGAGAGGLGGLGGLLPNVSVNRQDVSLRMKLIPSVNEHNMIRMDVDVEISDLVAPNFGGLGPATSKRTAKTPVFCKDQQTVVIGGLMSDRVTDTVQKVPILGDIPVLGFFFRSTTKQVQKSNIIIALTPYVIDDMDDLRRVADKKMRERREFIERFSANEDKARLEANIDYRRKRGMLEEINRSAREIDDEEQALRRIRERDLIDESTPIELPNQQPVRPRAQEPGRPVRPVSLDQER